ncbi:zinc finger protein 2 [Pieris rapae]|uniref:zinc finger protein 2 n=1 Tax=Pieris rapae TaxID=64459 RepID=UPI001E27C706|nr:zinc finger protein 2 [Pieris rapae]
MMVNHERNKINYKQICCTCLSENRINYTLMQIIDGVNILYNLLSINRDAYRDTFTKDVAKLHVCWECRAVIWKIIKFKRQLCKAKKWLDSVSSDHIAIEKPRNTLSQLSTYSENTNYIENFEVETQQLGDFVKVSEELPIYNSKAQLENNNISNTTKLVDIKTEDVKLEPNSIPVINEENKEFYTIIKTHRNEIDLEKRKKLLHINGNGILCHVCVQKFKDNKSLRQHIQNTHTQRKNYLQCDGCNNYIKKSLFNEHNDDHNQYYRCQLCSEILFLKKLVKQHLKVVHKKEPAEFYVRKTPFVKNPGSKPRLYPALKDVETSRGFACPECSEYFLTKRLRYNHIQKRHRKGFRCGVCFKVFSFKAHLNKHQLLHTKLVQDRKPCSKCGKSICLKSMATHMQHHAERSRELECVPCGKTFKSHATYDHHLKYTKAHATMDIYKYKCDHCGKAYRSKVEVSDHIHYTHMGKTQHACPLCNKPVPTKKSIAHHMRKWHNSNKTDPAKKEMCQICGQMFGCKKILREHIMRHTGERPLSCKICGNTFRQKASLYTHKRLVHKILFPKKKHISLIT